jgi:hypothetical protein
MDIESSVSKILNCMVIGTSSFEVSVYFTLLSCLSSQSKALKASQKKDIVLGILAFVSLPLHSDIIFKAANDEFFLTQLFDMLVGGGSLYSEDIILVVLDIVKNICSDDEVLDEVVKEKPFEKCLGNLLRLIAHESVSIQKKAIDVTHSLI